MTAGGHHIARDRRQYSHVLSVDKLHQVKFHIPSFGDMDVCGLITTMLADSSIELCKQVCACYHE